MLVEAFAAGAREVECGVLGTPDGGCETSLPAEVRVNGDHEFYDFAAKYLPEEATELDVPADLPDEVTARLRALAARVFEAVGCEGLARVDFFLMPDGELVVKRLRPAVGGVEIVSENPAYPVRLCRGDAIEVLGRVAWLSRALV